MKKTITGWIPLGQLESEDDGTLNLSDNKVCDDDIPVTITYDDGKPATKKVWEWMVQDPCGAWFIAEFLRDEASADDTWPTRPHKKLRSFEVEVDDE